MPGITEFVYNVFKKGRKTTEIIDVSLYSDHLQHWINDL